MAKLDEAKYAAVLGEYKPRPIHTEEENQRATDVLERLHTNAVLSPEQEALAEILTTLIEKFEEEHYALNAASPAEILKESRQSSWLESEG